MKQRALATVCVVLMLCLSGCLFRPSDSAQSSEAVYGVSDGVGSAASDVHGGFWQTIAEMRKRLFDHEEDTVPQEGHVGYSTEVGSFKISYVECELNWRGYSEIPTRGHQVARAHFTIENASSETKRCGYLDFTCVAGDTACNTFSRGVDALQMLSDIKSGDVVDGWLYYEIPIGSKTAILTYSPSSNGGSSDTAEFIIE